MSVRRLSEGREYLRVSKLRSGRECSPDDQHADNQRAALTRGVRLGEPYREVGAVSASRFATKPRDAFADLLADLDNGRFGADELWLWESSRGSRRASEWVLLVDLCEERGVKIHVTTHGRTYDPGNPRDRRSLLEDAIDSEYESAKISQRIIRTMAAEAARGRPHARPPFGYRRVFDQRTGRLITWEPDPVEAPIVVELFDRVNAGHSFAAIAGDLAARGVVHRSDRPFTAAHLRSMITHVAYVGKRSHHGVVVDGIWAGLIEPESFYQVQRLIGDPSRRTTKHGRAVHTLSMIIRCDVCGGPMSVTFRGNGKRPGVPAYQCHDSHHVRIGKDEVDQIVEGVIMAYLASPKVYIDFAATSGDSIQAQRLRDQIAAARHSLAEMDQATPEDLHEAKILARSVKALSEKIARLEAQERELTIPAALYTLISPGADVAERWQAAPISARRQVAKLLLSPGLLGEVRIRRAHPTRTPNGRLARQPARDRIIWRRN